jgi:hypothetical protein
VNISITAPAYDSYGNVISVKVSTAQIVDLQSLIQCVVDGDRTQLNPWTVSETSYARVPENPGSELISLVEPWDGEMGDFSRYVQMTLETIDLAMLRLGDANRLKAVSPLTDMHLLLEHYQVLVQLIRDHLRI